MTEQKLSDSFECKTELLFVGEQISFSQADIAESIISAKDFLIWQHQSVTLIVRRQNSGRFEVLKNIGTYFAAHMLGIKSVRVKEILSG